MNTAAFAKLLTIPMVLAGMDLKAANQIREPQPPVIPNRIFKLTNYGGVGDGKTVNTEAFAKAIEACGKAGGGSLVVPAGVYLTGPIKLVSHMALVVDKGATIQGTGKFSDFGLPDPLPTAQEELNGLKKSLHPLISGSSLTDVAIRGEGTIDGGGAPWWAKSDRAARTTGETYVPRPNMIVIRKCTRLQVANVTLSNSPMFHLVPQLCNEVLIDGVKILAPADAPNTDAIDPSNCRDVLIRHVLTDTGDDNIAFKANHDGPTENVTVTDCTFKHGHGVSVGSETTGGVRHILVQRCTFENTGTAIRIKTARDRGGVVEDVVYRDISMKDVDAAIYINLFYDDKTQAKNPEAKPVTSDTPIVRNVVISNITCEDAKSAGQITALPEAPATNLVLENVRITAASGFDIQDAKGLQFKDVSITTSPKRVAAQPSPAPSATSSSAPAALLQSGFGKKVIVAADGSGDFRTVQEAINAAPNGNKPGKPFLIHVKPGTYKEVVTISHDKGPILMEGEDAASTTITFANAASTLDANAKPLGTFNSATAFVDVDNFFAENITFENSFGKGSQALAISVGGDCATFRKCRFLGWQDTILLRQGRQYFEDCTVTGAVDFIFGAGTSWFEHCLINCVGSGFVTAASTPQENSFGFVFSNCTVTTEQGVKTYLGRPWRPFASVTYLNTKLGEGIRPEGWHNWSKPENEQTARYAEWKSTGGDLSARVPWAKQLTDEEAHKITREAVFGSWKPTGGPVELR